MHAKYFLVGMKARGDKGTRRTQLDDNLGGRKVVLHLIRFWCVGVWISTGLPEHNYCTSWGVAAFFFSYLKMWISFFEFWSLCIRNEPYHLSVVLQLLRDIFCTNFL